MQNVYRTYCIRLEFTNDTEKFVNVEPVCRRDEEMLRGHFLNNDEVLHIHGQIQR